MKTKKDNFNILLSTLMKKMFEEVVLGIEFRIISVSSIRSTTSDENVRSNYTLTRYY